MQFLNSLLTLVAALAVVGIFTVLVQRHGSTATARVFYSLLAFIGAGVFLGIILLNNYMMASSGLERIILREPVGNDYFGKFVFGFAKTRNRAFCMGINSLFALVTVIGSYYCAKWFLRTMGELQNDIRTAAWRQNSRGFALRIANSLAVAAVFAVVMWWDTYLLLFRTATLLYSDDMNEAAAYLPDLWRLFQQRIGTMGVAAMRILMLVYPMILLVAEKNYASCWTQLDRAGNLLGQERAALAAQAATIAPQPILAPNPIPNASAGLPAFIAAGPQPADGSAQPAPATMPSFIRPIPTNPGPVQIN